MYIQCPQCRTLNDYNDALLTTAVDRIQCQYCQATLHVPLILSAIYSNTLHQAQVTPASVDMTPDSVVIAPPGYLELLENNQLHPGRASSSGWWFAAILGILAVFILQYAYFMRDNLAHHIVLRPWLEKLCILTGCEIPMRKDISKIIIINRDIRSASDMNNILQVTITLKNIAPHIQPYPKMQLSFSDINGNKIASRRFNPGEYLSKQTDSNKGMMPQVPVIANLQIIDPGELATTFEFEFF